MKTYLINLSERKDRLTAASDEFRKIEVDFERVEAIHSSALDLSTPQLVTPGVQACWESHKLCYSKLLSSEEDYALICEDDFKVINKKLFFEALDWAVEKNVDLLQVGYLTQGVQNRFLNLYKILEMVLFKVIYAVTRLEYLPKSIKKISTRMRVSRYGLTSRKFIPDSCLPGTHCYIISRETAGKLIKLNYPQFLSADEFLISLSGMRSFSLYRTRRSAVTQNDLDPSIKTRFVGVEGK